MICLERRHFNRMRSVHRYTNDELDSLIAWLKAPEPATEAWAVTLLSRQRLLR